MSDDFLSALLEADQPVARQITFTDAHGQPRTGTVHFKRITGAQRRQLLQGLKYRQQKAAGEAAALETEIDLAANEGTKHQLIAFSACREDGKPLFKDAREVGALPENRIAALYAAATEVNREESPGEA